MYNKLHHIWHSKILSTRIKLDIYSAAVVSVLIYGCEIWVLDKAALDKLRAWNCRKLVVISGFDFREEYLAPEVDVAGAVRTRRLLWAGDILTAQEDFLPRRVAVAELNTFQSLGRPGGLFMDMPEFRNHTDIDGLVQIILNKPVWRRWVDRIGVEWREALLKKHMCGKGRTMDIGI